jgi:hypothetical protein
MGSQIGKVGLAKKNTVAGPPTRTMVASQLIGSATVMTSGVVSRSKTSPSGSVCTDQITSTSCSQSSANDCLNLGSEAETYQWLLNAGVPVSAFDPVALSDRHSSNKVINSELVDCADEISSLFATTSPEAISSHATEAEAAMTMDTHMPHLPAFPSAYASSANVTTDSSATDMLLTDSLSIHPCDDQVPLSDLLGNGSLPTIENDNWALW